LFVIGTAGHVDHGKSTLVRALTGIDPDRLREEKLREMTIDLGFAWLKLPGGLEVGIIDVPGHEHFIKNMLAGVFGMDLVLLVVSANESVKQQTREHLDILDLMEVPRAIVVISQSDLADNDQISLVSMEIEDLLKPTHFAGSPIIAVSSLTRQGLSELVKAIEKILSVVEPRRDIGKPRLPIDRVFSIQGSGTVVTGTLIDGSLTTGDEVEILPKGAMSRIRSLQNHKNQTNKIKPGNRVAVNLGGISVKELQRGDVLTRPGWLIPTTMVDARLRLVANLRNVLKYNTQISFHSGSADVMARVRLLENDEAKPGDTTWVQIILDEPLALVNGDHYVIRSPDHTLGGGIIIDSHAKQHLKRFRSETINILSLRTEGKNEKTLIGILSTRQPQNISDLILQSNIPEDIALSTIESLVQEGAIIDVGDAANRFFYTSASWNQLTDNVIEIVRSYHQKYPLRPGITKSELGSKIKCGTYCSDIFKKLADQNIVSEDKSFIKLAGFEMKLSKDQQQKINVFMRELNENPYSPAPDLTLETDLLNLMSNQGLIVKTAAGIIFSATAYSDVVARVLKYIKQNGKITLAETRDLFKTSRKYAQALLENLDEQKLTKRVGDDRISGEKS
jgi:selenocysteine-specific elongation factor